MKKTNKAKKKKKTHIPLRMNLLFFVVFLLFSVLILRLGFVQIVSGENYKREVEKTEDVTVDNPVPRGKIIDRYNRVVVDNEPLNSVTYTRLSTTKAQDKLEVAEKLSKMIKFSDKDLKKVTERDKKDFWILKHPKEAQKKVSAVEIKKLSNAEVYKLQLERVTDKEIKSVEKDLPLILIYSRMNAGYAMTQQSVKNQNVSNSEYAVVSEHLDELPGVETTTYWQRKNLYGQTLRSILGDVTSPSEGLPREQLDYFLSHGYSRNDQVGKSYIEQQYESMLIGQKAKVKNVTDKSGQVKETKTVFDGERGHDIVLTVDIQLQKVLEDVVTQKLMEYKTAKAGTQYLDRAFIVLMDPNTGDILAMVGKKYNKKTGKIDDYALGNINSAYEMGSAVKGATSLAGLDSGAISQYTRFPDTALKFRGTPPKKSSHSPYSAPNVREALEVSSNVFMWRTVIAIGNGHYGYDQPLHIDSNILSTMRNYYSQFGLGVKTGIDLPNETIGYRANKPPLGNVIDIGIGQLDTYTPLQMAQYVSTIANNGYRMQPHIVKEIRTPSDNPDEQGQLVYASQPTVLNRIVMSQKNIDVIKEGMRRVVVGTHGTSAKYYTGQYSRYSGLRNIVAAKTGTAETFVYGTGKANPPEVRNSTYVGFAPYNNPQIAFAAVAPAAYTPGYDNGLSKEIANEALYQYFKLRSEGQQKLEDANSNPGNELDSKPDPADTTSTNTAGN
ncbi:peptidoglycan D,D-transpeptidase FtsI family protein [Priestia koreensis]|uniref:peptidoglycan D,D-transpeptidase FtsI family protein n=1 Tax=Priestia koreensis TaxID=284581 RepID=UPI001F595D2F|nr:penicillin-binding protein 2 [Priestia koreensis]UNL83411.1 penicillin-binding protein 2 [Priestia koreensis]